MTGTAQLLFYRKRRYDDGGILEMKIWRVSSEVPGSLHLLQYSLFYGTDRARLVGYDNERGKGDHRHFGDREDSYFFVSPERLMADFLEDVARLRGDDL